MDYKESEKTITVLLDGEKFTIRKYGIDNEGRKILRPISEKTEEIIKNKLPEGYVSMDEVSLSTLENQVHLPSYEESLHFHGRIDDIIKGEITEEEFGLMITRTKTPHEYDDYEYKLNNYDKLKVMVKHHNSYKDKTKMKIDLKNNPELIKHVDLTNAEYDITDYDPLETENNLVFSDETFNYEFRIIDSDFYEDKTVFLERHNFFIPSMIKYIEDELNYNTPYTPPQNFENKKITLKPHKTFTQKLTTNPTEEIIKNNLQLIIKINKDGWYIENLKV